MTQQLTLITIDKEKLSESDKEIGRRGIAAARAALDNIVRPQAA